MFVAKASAQGIQVMEGTEILRLCCSILIAAIYRAVCFGAHANLAEQKNERQHKMAHQIKERRQRSERSRQSVLRRHCKTIVYPRNSRVTKMPLFRASEGRDKNRNATFFAWVSSEYM